LSISHAAYVASDFVNVNVAQLLALLLAVNRTQLLAIVIAVTLPTNPALGHRFASYGANSVFKPTPHHSIAVSGFSAALLNTPLSGRGRGGQS